MRLIFYLLKRSIVYSSSACLKDARSIAPICSKPRPSWRMIRPEHIQWSHCQLSSCSFRRCSKVPMMPRKIVYFWPARQYDHDRAGLRLTISLLEYIQILIHISLGTKQVHKNSHFLGHEDITISGFRDNSYVWACSWSFFTQQNHTPGVGVMSGPSFDCNDCDARWSQRTSIAQFTSDKASVRYLWNLFRLWSHRSHVPRSLLQNGRVTAEIVNLGPPT